MMEPPIFNSLANVDQLNAEATANGAPASGEV
jgi:hypothetical protein